MLSIPDQCATKTFSYVMRQIACHERVVYAPWHTNILFTFSMYSAPLEYNERLTWRTIASIRFYVSSVASLCACCCTLIPEFAISLWWCKVACHNGCEQ